MKPIKFDPSGPFDMVHGADACGRAYFQSGRYFNVNGEEVTEADVDVEAVRAEDTVQALADAAVKVTELDAELAEKSAEIERAKLDLAAANEQIAALKEASLPNVTKTGKKA